MIEWLVEFRNNRVALFAPKAGREPVWEIAINRYLPNLGGVFGTGFAIFNHSDLQRGGKWQQDLNHVAARADAIIIDEAHHFRNPGTLGAVPIDVTDPFRPGPRYIPGEGKVRPSRYRRLYEICEGNRAVQPKAARLLQERPAEHPFPCPATRWVDTRDSGRRRLPLRRGVGHQTAMQ